MPDSLCGTHVTSDLTADLIPPGEIAEDLRERQGWPKTVCRVLVDGVVVLYIEMQMQTTPLDPMELATEHWQMMFGDPRRLDIGDSAVVGDHGIAVLAACPGYKEGASYSVDILVKNRDPDDVDSNRVALEAFAREYFPQSRQDAGC
ncbi:hypothetical protein [Streptomyces sodiiphilus]|uniref:hypothetical protein n=1 Tax=Streptomyces sodiiphilus TaxID=226217 RepID=UPI0031D81861